MSDLSRVFFAGYGSLLVWLLALFGLALAVSMGMRLILRLMWSVLLLTTVVCALAALSAALW